MDNLFKFFATTQGTSAEAGGIAKAMESRMSIGKQLPVKQISNIEFRYAKEVSLGQVARRVINKNFAVVPGGMLVPEAEPIAILGRATQIDRRLASADPNARGNELARAGRAIALDADDLVFNGDRAKAATDINGLVSRCKGDQHVVLEGAGGNGGALTLGYMHLLIDAVEDVGAGRDVYLNKPLWRAFKGLVLAEAGGASLADVSSEIFQYEGVRFRPVGKGLDGKPLLDFDETQGTNNETASIYCVAPGAPDVELSGVRLLLASNSIEIVEQGNVGSMISDVVEYAFGLAIFDQTAAARLSGVTEPAD